MSPEQFLTSLIGHKCLIKLKWGPSYSGTLLSTDSYMNVQLADSSEIEADGTESALGEIVIRYATFTFTHTQGMRG